MRFSLDPGSERPLSAQLSLAIADRIERGTLAPGERLPPVRTLAVQLDLAPNTVAKAYRGLEERGLLVGRGRRGTFVADSIPGRPGAERRLGEAARAFVTRSRALGASDAAAVRAVRRALRGD